VAVPDAAFHAGAFGTWLADTQRAIRDGLDALVPCGDCTACCTSSQFVHIAPDETDALARIPAQLLFPAPGFPPGHVLMGYDERGHCPMFADGRCSVYEHRPRTCRTYDCRVFAATDVVPEQPSIAARVKRWRFSFASEADTAAHARVLQAAADGDTGARNATERAVRAVVSAVDHGRGREKPPYA